MTPINSPQSLSFGEKQVLWVVGAIDRLVNLGAISNAPITLAQQHSIEAFNDIDTYIEALFESDSELISTFLAVVLVSLKKKKLEELSDSQTVQLIGISELLTAYKNDREVVERVALEAMMLK